MGLTAKERTEFSNAINGKNSKGEEAMQKPELKKMSLTELAVLYNQHTPLKKIKKFSDKTSAIERTWAALLSAKVKGKKVDVPKKKATSTSTKAKFTRHQVKVNGETFRSVAQAFEELKLPMSQHIKFRKELKADGRKVFNDDGAKYTFTLVQA